MHNLTYDNFNIIEIVFKYFNCFLKCFNIYVKIFGEILQNIISQY